MPSQVYILIAVAAVMFPVIGSLSLLAHYYTLGGIKAKTVGDGQHGTARFATENEIKKSKREGYASDHVLGFLETRYSNRIKKSKIT